MASARARVSKLTRSARGADQPFAEGSQASAPSPWLEHELMVAARSGASLAEIAADHGATLRRAPGPSGLGAVVVPEGVSLAQLRAELAEDERVAAVERVGRIAGAGDKARAKSKERRAAGAEEVATSSGLAWHLDAMDVSKGTPSGLKNVVVAVLDTGVAYEAYTSGGVTWRAAPSLSGSTFVSPFDFVNGDEHANDDNQHGTHVASLIASNGSYTGVAPGVSLMPLKVLDSASLGSEVDLIDAILHAVEHGADVINMSLCFSDGYVPSRSLEEALQLASDEGVVMVAAAGNDAGRHAHYPAASPLVIGVGASSLATGGGLEAASYSDLGATLDLLAPGGDLSADHDGNGVYDGVIGESFDPSDPKRFGAWLFAGTSQSAALTSGAAALLLASGASDPLEVALALQDGAGAGFGAVTLTGGRGLGSLDVAGAQSALSGVDALRVTEEVSVAALPWLAPSADGAQVAPMVKVTALDEAGAPLAGAGVLVSFWGSGGETIVSCTTDSAGACTVTGPSAAAKHSSGADAPLAFAFGVDGVTWADRVVFRPGGALFASDALVVLVEALEAEGLLDGTMIAWRWDAGTDATLGAMADAYMLVDAGAGATSRPVGLLFTPEALGSDAVVTDLAVNLDGSGIISDPLGVTPAKLVTLSGSGIISDTLGLYGARLLILSGSGIISDTLGFSPKDIYSWTSWTLSGSGIISDPLGYDGSRVSLTRGSSLTGLSLDGTALGEQLDAGGWLTEDGLAGASLLTTSLSMGTVTRATSTTAW